MKVGKIGYMFVCLLFAIGLCGLFGCSDNEGDTTDGDMESNENDTDNEGIIDGDEDADNSEIEMEDEADQEADVESSPTVLKVMTYNILCFFCDATYDPWEDRVGYITDTFERYNPDLIGTQELFGYDDLNDILQANKDYDAFYYIDDGTGIFTEYPDSAIFYKRDRFEIVESGVYWLSNDPDTPWTGFGDSETTEKIKASAFWRLVVWAVFNDKESGKDFYFSSTHYDNNIPHQAQSAPISLEYIESYAEKMPVIFVGDFNSRPDTEAYAILTEGVDGEGFSITNSFDIAEKWSAASNEEPAPEYDPSHRIDHIFIAGQAQWEVKDWVVDMYVYGESNLPPSDHYPMYSELHLK